MTSFWLAYSGLNKLKFFLYKILCNFAVKGYTCNQKYKTLAEVDKIGSAGQAFSAKPDKLSWMPGPNMAEEIWLHKIVLWPQNGHHIYTNTQISTCNLNLEEKSKKPLLSRVENGTIWWELKTCFPTPPGLVTYLKIVWLFSSGYKIKGQSKEKVQRVYMLVLWDALWYCFNNIMPDSLLGKVSSLDTLIK